MGSTPAGSRTGSGLDRIAPTIAGLIGYDALTPRSGAARRSRRRSVRADPRARGRDSSGGCRERWHSTPPDFAGSAAMTSTTRGRSPCGNDRLASGRPAAILTTIGTGGLPLTARHRWNRDPRSERSAASRRGARPYRRPSSRRSPTIGTTPRPSGRGSAWWHARLTIAVLIGGTWYLDHDRDDLLIGTGRSRSRSDEAHPAGYGVDPTTDMLGVVLSGTPQRMDRDTGRIVTAVHAARAGRDVRDHRDRGRARRGDRRAGRRSGGGSSGRQPMSSPARLPGDSSWIKPSWPRTTSRPTTWSARWTR